MQQAGKNRLSWAKTKWIQQQTTAFGLLVLFCLPVQTLAQSIQHATNQQQTPKPTANQASQASQSHHVNKAKTAATAENQATLEPLLVALSVNQVEIDTIDALQRGEHYYMPLAAFEQSLKLTPTTDESGWHYNTPIGTLSLAKTAVIVHQQQDFVDIAAIKAMGIPIAFNTSAYAIEIYPPWNEKKADKTAKKAKQSIDYFPEKAAINQIDISGNWSQSGGDKQANTWRFSTQVGLSGHALGGFFGANVQYYRDGLSASDFSLGQDVHIDNWYWADFGQRFALRLGLNQPAYGVGGGEFSGISMAYSNRGIERHIAHFDHYSRSLLQSNFSDYRNISGQGPVGGIAELRINSRPIARVRIGLDKRYEFRNLDASRLYDNEYNVEIALFEHNFSNQPLKVIPYRLAKRQSNVGTGELLVEAGMGQVGNVLDGEQHSNSDNYLYGYMEYGLHNNVGVRGGVAKNDKTAGMVGLNVGLSQQANWDISYRHEHDRKQWQSLLSYQAKHFSANYQYDYQQNQQSNAAKNNNKTTEEQRHTLYLYYRPNDYLNASTNIYYNEYSDKADENYFTATLNVRPHQRLYGSISRDRDNEYSYRLNWQVPDNKTHIGIDGDKASNGLSIDHNLTAKTNIGAAWRHYRDDEADFYRAYVNYQWNEKNKLFANVNRRGQETGYELGWQSEINRGLSFSLGYQHNRSVVGDVTNADNSPVFGQSPTLADNHYLYLQFNISLARTPGYGYRFDKRGYSNNGTIIADIQYDKDLAIDSDKMQLQLNGQGVRSEKIADGRYVIHGVRPGVYEMGLDNKNLPIEYSADNLDKATIKVEHAATTVVPYHLQKRLGLSGQLSQATETTVTVSQNGKVVSTTQSNDFGYYQVLGLKPGVYQVSAKGHQSVTVTLENTFLFEVDLNR